MQKIPLTNLRPASLNLVLATVNSTCTFLHHSWRTSRMSQIPARPDCANMLCQKKGFINCTRCRGAAPPTMYCSRRCQRDVGRLSAMKWCLSLTRSVILAGLAFSPSLLRKVRLFFLPFFIVYSRFYNDQESVYVRIDSRWIVEPSD